MFKLLYRAFITFFVSMLLFFTASHAQNKNTDILPPILSLILSEPEVKTIAFDTPTSNGVFIVPDGVTSINVVALGASGSDGDADGTVAGFFVEDSTVQFGFDIPGALGGAGGAGGRSEGTIIVTPGEQLTIIVGSEGVTNSPGGSGGGRSEVLRNQTALIVAGGGGGGGYGDGVNGIDGGNGGSGGGLSGGNGSDIPAPEGLGISATGTTPGLGGQGGVGNTPGQGHSIIVGQRDTVFNMSGILGRFGLLIQGTNGSAPGQDVDSDGVPDVLGAPTLDDITFGGSGSGITFPNAIGGGGSGGFSGGGGGGGFAGGGGGLPSTYTVGPRELEINGEIIDAGNEVAFSAGGGGGGGSSFIPEGGSTEVGVNSGNGSIIITYQQ